MTHLTTNQIMQITDGTLDYASQAQCTSHLAVCERCRKEVELQKALAKSARRLPSATTSTNFVREIMARVVPQPGKTWKARLIDNLGNVVAMAMVLAVVGYAVSNPSLFKVQEQASQKPSYIPQSVSDAYTKILQSFTEKAQSATKQVVSSTGTENNDTIPFTVLSLIILITLDQVVLKRTVGMRMRH